MQRASYGYGYLDDVHLGCVAHIRVIANRGSPRVLEEDGVLGLLEGQAGAESGAAEHKLVSGQSPLVSRVNTWSTSVKHACCAGTKQPICAMICNNAS